jgi:hypothetical protein
MSCTHSFAQQHRTNLPARACAAKCPLAQEPPSKQRRIAPPKPKAGDRRPRAYSPDELDSLYATAHSINWQSMISLKTPPSRRIVTHEALVSTLQRMKRKLENLRRRNHFPACIAVTEFDPDERDGVTTPTANFHIAFASTLSEAQQATLREWWLEVMSLQSNQGRYFQYDAKGGGPRLQPRTTSPRTSPTSTASPRRGRRWVKFPVEWLPPRIDCRLWFVVGTKRLGAKSGRKLRASTHQKRRRYDGEHASHPPQRLRASTHSREGEHPSLPITTDAFSLWPSPNAAVTRGNQPSVSMSSAPPSRPITIRVSANSKAKSEALWRFCRDNWSEGLCACRTSRRFKLHRRRN